MPVLTGAAVFLAAVAGWLGCGPRALLADRGNPRRPQEFLARFQRPRRNAVADLLASLREELRAGAPARTALVRAGTNVPDVCPRALGAARLGGSVAKGLRTDGIREPLLVALAALWEVSEGSGAAMAGAVDRLVAAAEASEELRREVTAQLAGPRASVRMLALLPFAGMLLAWVMGANGLAWLLGSPWGWGCLVIGLAFEGLGLLWVSRLVARVESEL